MSTDARPQVHTDALETLGTIIDEREKRDAIHLAVEPIMAGSRLMPGEHVSLNGGMAWACARGQGVGIVDPFIDGMVEGGEYFWLIVYPRQITSLRHVWSHPDFPESDPEAVAPVLPVSQKTKDAAEQWLRDWHASVDVPWGFEETVRQIERADGEYVYVGGEDASGSIPDEWYIYYETWKGKPFVGGRPGWFSCAC